MRNKMVLGLIGIIVALLIVLIININNPSTNNEVNATALTNYFSEELRTEAIQRMGGAIPVEGFDPSMYRGVYPALIQSDFDNTSAYGGIWKYNAASDQLIFERIDSEPITSADGTVTEEGMQTLLFNLAGRFQIELKDTSSVDAILSRLA